MATLTADTIQNILQTVSDLRGESTTDTTASRIRAVSRAEQTVAKRKMFIEHLRRNITIAGSGTGDYTIGTSTYPMRKKGLSEVFVGGVTEEHRYSVVDFFRYQNLVNTDSSVKVAYEWYDQENDAWKIHINPVVESGTTIYVSYYYMPPKKTSLSDVIVCPDMDAVIYYAMSYIYEGEEEEEKAADKRNEAEQVITDLLSLENSPARNQYYAMGAIENQTRSRGYGTY